MSNFICEYCGTACIDTPNGYKTGCEHYPPDWAYDVFYHALNYRGASIQDASVYWKELEACIGRLIAVEREACAKVCEQPVLIHGGKSEVTNAYNAAQMDNAAAIRARK